MTHQSPQESVESSQPEQPELATDAHTSKASRTKMWISLFAVCGILLAMGAINRGSLSGMATGHRPQMGCGGGPIETTVTNSQETQPKAQQRIGADSQQPSTRKKVEEAKVLPLPELLKKIAKQRQLMRAKYGSNPPKVRGSQLKIEAKPVPLPKLLAQIKQQRQQRANNPSTTLKRIEPSAHPKMQVLPLPELLKKLKQQRSKAIQDRKQ